MSQPQILPALEAVSADTHLFRINPLTYLAVPFLVLATVVPIQQQPILAPLLLVPAFFIWWTWRTRTRVTAEGITTRSWRSHTSLSWDEIKGVNFPKRGFGQVVTHDDKFIRLGGVSFRDLPRLAVASSGRIPHVGSLDNFENQAAAAAEVNNKP